MNFDSLGLAPSLLAAVAKAGYQTPTDIQVEAIPAVLAGRDLMAGASTGSGKTAAFALPILQALLTQQAVDINTPRVLVLTPTRELAQQVHASFVGYAGESGMRCVLAYGGASIGPQAKALKQGADVLVATPGRLLDHLIKGSVDLSCVTHLVFDEADRMLDMGFIDEIKRILRRLPEKRQTLLFSATFDDALFKLSQTLLNDPLLIEVNARNSAAADVEQLLYAVDEERKRELVSHLIGARNWQQVLIFTRTKQGADKLAQEMCKDGLKTCAIHGDKSQGARDKALAEFKEGKVRVLVATDVAARGIDIPTLKYVINFELPYIAEDYIHRIGRTGRAGEKGWALSLVSLDEQWLLEQIEALTDTRMVPQWLPGYEPDLTREAKNPRSQNRGAQKRRLRDSLTGKAPKNRRRPRK